MYADIEALILSGEAFNNDRSSSPPRTNNNGDDGGDDDGDDDDLDPDPDPGWHDDEYVAQRRKEFNEKGLDYDSDAERREHLKAKEDRDRANAARPSVGMGPGRTGVKGVIRDRDEAALLQMEERAKRMAETRKTMEATSVAAGGKTYLEEEWEKALRGEKADQLVMNGLAKIQERAGVFGMKKGRFGHLREVGLKSFLPAVEEDEGTWVVLHIYDPSLERCYLIDEKLAKLAREVPDVKFLRARAAVLGFASLNKNDKPKYERDKENDEDDDDDDDEPEDFRDDEVDLDVLPTMLVYRNRELVFNWVRVDWEAGDATIEELLRRHRILTKPRTVVEFRLPDDSELDLVYSDDDV